MTYENGNERKKADSSVPIPLMGLGTRISAIADLFESRKDAANAAGVSASTLQRWIAGEGSAAFDSVIKLASAKGISLDWIASGEGGMYLGVKEDAQPEQPTECSETHAYIPLYDARCSAGGGAWNQSVTKLADLAFTKYSLQKKGLHPSKLSAVQVDGDSNEPLLSNCDTVMIDHSRNQIQGEAFYVIRLNEHLYAKRLQIQFDGGIQIISANPAYLPVHVPRESVPDLDIIGRVVWVGRWM